MKNQGPEANKRSDYNAKLHNRISEFGTTQTRAGFHIKDAVFSYLTNRPNFLSNQHIFCSVPSYYDSISEKDNWSTMRRRYNTLSSTGICLELEKEIPKEQCVSGIGLQNFG